MKEEVIMCTLQESEVVYINLTNSGLTKIPEIKLKVRFLGMLGSRDLKFCNYGIADLTMFFNYNGEAFTLRKYLLNNADVCECKVIQNVPLNQYSTVTVFGTYVFNIPITPYSGTIYPYDSTTSFGVFNDIPQNGEIQRFKIFPGGSSSNHCDIEEIK